MKWRRVSSAAATLLVLVTAAACGADDDEPVPATTGTVTVEGITFPRPEKTNVTIGEPATDIGSLPFYHIMHANLGKQFGIELSFPAFNGNSPANQALVAGQIDAVNGSAGALTLQNTALKPIITYLTSSKVSDIFVTAKDVRSADDLRGKSIAVSSVGSFSYAQALLGLKHLGLSKSDVTIVTVGNDAARLAALKGGSVAASIQARSLAPELTADGYHVLVDLGQVPNDGFIGTALAFPREFVEKYPNTVLAVTAIYQMGVHYYLTKGIDLNSQLWAEKAEIPVEEAREQVEIEFAAGWAPVDGRCNVATVRFMQEVLKETNPQVANVDPESICTNRYVDKLKEMGFQKALGVEGY
jgi:NitT/TauT family transport system substrate-binding protein